MCEIGNPSIRATLRNISRMERIDRACNVMERRKGVQLSDLVMSGRNRQVHKKLSKKLTLNYALRNLNLAYNTVHKWEV